jgi:hypothetical protein
MYAWGSTKGIIKGVNSVTHLYNSPLWTYSVVQTLNNDFYKWEPFETPILIGNKKGVVDVMCSDKRVFFLTQKKESFSIIRLRKFSDIMFLLCMREH